MARDCQVCGKTSVLGNQVTHRGKAKYLGGVGTKVTGISRRQVPPQLAERPCDDRQRQPQDAARLCAVYPQRRDREAHSSHPLPDAQSGNREMSRLSLGERRRSQRWRFLAPKSKRSRRWPG